MEANLFDPDTSDLVPSPDSGLQTEPAADCFREYNVTYPDGRTGWLGVPPGVSAEAAAGVLGATSLQPKVLTMRDLPQLYDVQALLTERDRMLQDLAVGKRFYAIRGNFTRI